MEMENFKFNCRLFNGILLIMLVSVSSAIVVFVSFMDETPIFPSALFFGGLGLLAYRFFKISRFLARWGIPHNFLSFTVQPVSLPGRMSSFFKGAFLFWFVAATLGSLVFLPDYLGVARQTGFGFYLLLALATFMLLGISAMLVLTARLKLEDLEEREPEPVRKAFEKSLYLFFICLPVAWILLMASGS